jgi:hypothetical protein
MYILYLHHDLSVLGNCHVTKQTTCSNTALKLAIGLEKSYSTLTLACINNRLVHAI